MLESFYMQWKEKSPSRGWLIWSFKHLTYSEGPLSPFVVALHAVCPRWSRYHFLQVRIWNRKTASRLQLWEKYHPASKGAVNSPGPWQCTAWAIRGGFTSRLCSGWAQLPTEPIYSHSISHNTDVYANQVLWASCLLVTHKGSGNSWKDTYTSDKYILGCHKHQLYPWFLTDDTCRINSEKAPDTASGRKCTFLDIYMGAAI